MQQQQIINLVIPFLRNYTSMSRYRDFFLSWYPYSIRDLILNKRTSKDARLTPR